MDRRTQRKHKQKNKKKLRESKKKIKYPRQQDIIIFFDDDENKQLTPYEIDILKSLTIEDDKDFDFYNQFEYLDEGDLIFNENAFPRAMNKADRKKLKRKMKRESMGGNIETSKESEEIMNNEVKPKEKEKTTPNKKSTKKNLLLSKFTKAKDPLSELRPKEEPEFEIIYYNGQKPIEQNETKESIEEIKKEFDKLSIDVEVDEKVITGKESEIDIITTNNQIEIKESNDEGPLFKTENIQFSNLFEKALEENKLSIEELTQVEEESKKYETPEEERNIIDFDKVQSESESEDERLIIFDRDMDDSDEVIADEVYEYIEHDYDEYLSDSDDIFQDEEDNLLYEFYLEHGSDSFSNSDSFEKDLSLTDDDESDSEMEEKHRQILRGSFKEEYRRDKKLSNVSNDSPRSNGSRRRKKKLSKRERKALRRDKHKTKPYDRKDLFRLNMNFRKFISTSMVGDSKPISIPTKTQRRQLILLAGMYGLDVVPIGPKSSGVLGIKYTKNTKLIDIKESKKNIRRMMQNPELKLEKLEKMDKLKSKKKFQVDNYVGEHSSPISPDNLGHIILKKIGWNGGGLGINEQGIKDPLKVMIKKNKTGLGY